MEVKKILIRGSYLFFLLVFLITSCNPFGFGRSQAGKAIAAEQQFKNPAFLNVDVSRMSNALGRAWQISQDDTPEAAAERSRQDFYKKQPQLWAAEHLGYIKLYFEKPELGGREMEMPNELYRQRLGVWRFKVRAEVTEAGNKMWKDIGLPENNNALPLAVRGAPNVTGLTDEDATTKKAEFSYKWEATPLGKAIDPRMPAFAILPEELKQILQRPTYDMFGGSGNKTFDTTTEQKGICYFKKFDDGWRLLTLSLL